MGKAFGVATLLTLFAALSNAVPTQIMHRPSGVGSNPHRRRAAALRQRASHPRRSNDGWASIAYFGNWDIYDRNFMPNQIPADRLTHLLYSFANIASDGTITLSDENADIQKHYDGDDWNETGNNVYGGFKQLFLLKQQNRHFKTMLSIGGWTYQGSFAPITQSSWRAQFVKTAVQMVADFGLDGLDVDYEYPTATTIEAFYELLKAIRAGLTALEQQIGTKTPFLLSIAAPAGPSNYDPMGPYISKIAQEIDYFNLMSYDYCGPTWQEYACDVANLQGGMQFNTITAVNWYLSQGAGKKQISMGNPLYGYAYSQTKGHNQTFTGNPPGDFGEAGTYDYRNLPLGSSPRVSEDIDNIFSYSYDSGSKTLASYDTPKIAGLKAQWLMQQGLAGAMYWEISGDKTGDADSLVYQYASAFQGNGGLESSCNHVSYPTSSYDNIKNGMGVKAVCCSGDGGSTSPSPVSSGTGDATSSSSGPTSTPPPTTGGGGHNSYGSTVSSRTSSTVATSTTSKSSATTSTSGSKSGHTGSTPGQESTTSTPSGTGSGASSGFVPCTASPSTSSTCRGVKIWKQKQVYKLGNKVQCNGNLYKANWYTDATWNLDDNNTPWPRSQYGAWSLVSSC